ncbi:MAG TPA: amidohydrolase family protein [Roseiarcus sp.]|jgi:cytosine/adenosine deaminase-related metal-dependent hydrolase
MSVILIKDAVVLTMRGGAEDVIQGDLLIRNQIIEGVGGSLTAAEGAEVVDGRNFIVIPGLINAHMHTWQTALRSLASNWTLPEYMRWIHAGLATHFRPRDIHVATLVGALNQIDNGTTTLVDWCHNNPTPDHTNAAVAALRSAGIRAMFMHGSPKPDPKPGQPPFWEVPHPREEVIRLREELADAELLSLGLAILGPHYSTLDVTLKDFRLAQEFGLIASMHQGGGTPRSPDGWMRLEAEGLLNRFVNIVHGNDLSDEQLQRFVARDVRFTAAPESEMICGHGHPIIGRLRDLGVAPSLGSDIETGHSSDMLASARIALSHQRALDNLEAKRRGEFGGKSRLRTRDALAWVTVEGARMLGQEDRIGAIALGKQADLVMLRADALNMQPIHDAISAVVMQSNPSNIDSVMIAGKWRKRRGRLISEDLKPLIEELGESGRRISRDVGLQPDDLT